jgi:uncharacterized protein (TIGR02186 family)
MKYNIPSALIWLVFSMLISTSMPAQAQQEAPRLYSKPVIADISQNKIEIHSQFNGETILLYGARNAPGEIIAVVSGPNANAIIGRKDNIAGMWMQVERKRFKAIPLYFAIAATRDPASILLPQTMVQLSMKYPDIALDDGLIMANALKDKLRERGWLNEKPAPISYFGDTLFRAHLKFPNSLPKGHYTIDVFLIDAGRISALQSIPLEVVKVGLDSWLSDAAHHHPWWYGLGAAMLSLSGGWLGTRLVKRR